MAGLRTFNPDCGGSIPPGGTRGVEEFGRPRRPHKPEIAWFESRPRSRPDSSAGERPLDTRKALVRHQLGAHTRVRLWVGPRPFTAMKRVRVPHARPFRCRPVGRAADCSSAQALVRVQPPEPRPCSSAVERRDHKAQVRGSTPRAGTGPLLRAEVVAVAQWQSAGLWPRRRRVSTGQSPHTWVRHRRRGGAACKAVACSAQRVRIPPPAPCPRSSADRAPASEAGRRRFDPRVGVLVVCPSGQGAVCKAAYAGSNPVTASECRPLGNGTQSRRTRTPGCRHRVCPPTAHGGPAAKPRPYR